MKLRIVGSSGTYPTPGRPASGYLIEQGETRVWCDAGPGTFTSLPIDSDMVDAVVISHQHPDHCTDLFTAFHAWTYRPEPRRGVPVYGPKSLWERVELFLDKSQGSALYDTFDFKPVWTGDEIAIGDVAVSFVEMDHSVPTVGSRWEANNRTLFFTGDTGPGGEWHSRAAGVDVLLSEAALQGPSDSKAVEHHLTATEAGQIARDAGVGRLVLTHIPPYMDASLSVHEAELAFDRPVTLATPGMSVDI